jgi:hypothetical protein
VEPRARHFDLSLAELFFRHLGPLRLIRETYRHVLAPATEVNPREPGAVGMAAMTGARVPVPHSLHWKIDETQCQRAASRDRQQLAGHCPRRLAGVWTLNLADSYLAL